MYKRKEWIGLILIIVIIVMINIFFQFKKEENVKIEEPLFSDSSFIVKIEGEVVRPMELQFINPISYGVLFLRIKNNINEFSDLSSFNLNAVISSNTTIVIPTYDVGNLYSADERICINRATLTDLKKLPQIGEKRGQKILDYIALNGEIKSWDVFFKIASVPENVKDEIKKQAFL